jgi:hypothetical protein
LYTRPRQKRPPRDQQPSLTRKTRWRKLARRADLQVRRRTDAHGPERRPQQHAAVHIACRPQSFNTLQQSASFTNVMLHALRLSLPTIMWLLLHHGKVVRSLFPYLVLYKAAARPIACPARYYILPTTHTPTRTSLSYLILCIVCSPQSKTVSSYTIARELLRLPGSLLQTLLRPPWTAPIRVI